MGVREVAELLVEPLLLLGGQGDRVRNPGATVGHAGFGLRPWREGDSQGRDDPALLQEELGVHVEEDPGEGVVDPRERVRLLVGDPHERLTTVAVEAELAGVPIAVAA